MTFTEAAHPCRKSPALFTTSSAALLLAYGSVFGTPPESPPAAVGAAAPVATETAAICEEMLKQGDVHDVKLEAQEALQCYLVLEKAQPQNPDVLVRIARQYRHLMQDAESESEKVKLGNMALQYGKRAASVGPKNSDAQLSCAISYGKMLPLQPKKEQVAASKMIKDGAEKAIQLNSRNDLAWNILGRWHRNVAGMGTITRTLAAMIYEKLPEATNEEAVDCFEKAIKINPKRLMHYIELGKVYAQMGREDDARRCLEKGLAMPCLEKDDAALKASGREVLVTLR